MSTNLQLLILFLSLLHTHIIKSINTWEGDGRTWWRSTSDFIPQQSTAYGSILIQEKMRMSFEFEFIGRNQTSPWIWEQYFRIGFNGSISNGCTGENSRYPTLWLMDTANKLHFSVAQNKGCTTGWNLGPILNTGTKINIIMEWDQNGVQITLNGNEQFSSGGIDRNGGTSSNFLGRIGYIWFASDGTTPNEYIPGNAVLRNIIITSNTTDAPTTAPTTNAPITSAPSTHTPTTVPPVTNQPVTSAPPITGEPTTHEPTTNIPTRNPTIVPITSTPTTSPPITKMPSINPTIITTTSEQPVTAAPVTNIPITNQPITNQPISLNPTTFSPSLIPSASPTKTSQDLTNTTKEPTLTPTTPSPTYPLYYYTTSTMPTRRPPLPYTTSTSLYIDSDDKTTDAPLNIETIGNISSAANVSDMSTDVQIAIFSSVIAVCFCSVCGFITILTLQNKKRRKRHNINAKEPKYHMELNGMGVERNNNNNNKQRAYSDSKTLTNNRSKLPSMRDRDKKHAKNISDGLESHLKHIQSSNYLNSPRNSKSIGSKSSHKSKSKSKSKSKNGMNRIRSLSPDGRIIESVYDTLTHQYKSHSRISDHEPHSHLSISVMNMKDATPTPATSPNAKYRNNNDIVSPMVDMINRKNTYTNTFNSEHLYNSPSPDGIRFTDNTTNNTDDINIDYVEHVRLKQYDSNHTSDPPDNDLDINDDDKQEEEEKYVTDNTRKYKVIIKRKGKLKKPPKIKKKKMKTIRNQNKNKNKNKKNNDIYDTHIVYNNVNDNQSSSQNEYDGQYDIDDDDGIWTSSPNEYEEGDEYDDDYMSTASPNTVATTPQKHLKLHKKLSLKFLNSNHDKKQDKFGDNYDFICVTLKKVDKQYWSSYLDNFKHHKVKSNRLVDLLPEDWKELIPQIGPRNEFKRIWKQKYDIDNNTISTYNNNNSKYSSSYYHKGEYDYDDNTTIPDSDLLSKPDTDVLSMTDNYSNYSIDPVDDPVDQKHDKPTMATSGMQSNSTTYFDDESDSDDDDDQDQNDVFDPNKNNNNNHNDKDKYSLPQINDAQSVLSSIMSSNNSSSYSQSTDDTDQYDDNRSQYTDDTSQTDLTDNISTYTDNTSIYTDNTDTTITTDNTDITDDDNYNKSKYQYLANKYKKKQKRILSPKNKKMDPVIEEEEQDYQYDQKNNNLLSPTQLSNGASINSINSINSIGSDGVDNHDDDDFKSIVSVTSNASSSSWNSSIFSSSYVGSEPPEPKHVDPNNLPPPITDEFSHSTDSSDEPRVGIRKFNAEIESDNSTDSDTDDDDDDDQDNNDNDDNDDNNNNVAIQNDNVNKNDYINYNNDNDVDNDEDEETDYEDEYEEEEEENEYEEYSDDNSNSNSVSLDMGNKGMNNNDNDLYYDDDDDDL